MEKGYLELFSIFWVGLPAVIAAISSLRNGWKLNQAKTKLDQTEAKIQSGVAHGVQNAIGQRSVRRFGEAD